MLTKSHRKAWLVLIGAMLVLTIVYANWFVLPYELLINNSYNYGEVGFITSIAPIVETVLALVFGEVSGWRVPKWTILVGALLAILATILIASAGVYTEIGGILSLVVADFLINAGALVILFKLLNKNDSVYVSFDQVMIGLEYMSGPVFGGFLLQNLKVTGLLVGNAALAAVGLFMVYAALGIDLKRIGIYLATKKGEFVLRLHKGRGRRLHKVVHEVERLPSKAKKLGIRISFLFLFFSAIFAMIGYGYWDALPLLVGLGKSTLSLSGLMLALLEVPFTAGALAAGIFLKRLRSFGVRRIFIYFLIIAMLPIFLLLFTISANLYLIFLSVIPFFFLSISEVLLWTNILRNYKEDVVRPFVYATAGSGIGGAFGDVIVGNTISAHGFQILFISFLVTSVGLLLYTRFVVGKLD